MIASYILRHCQWSGVNPILQGRQGLTYYFQWLDTRANNDAAACLLAKFYRVEREWNEYMQRDTEFLP